MKPIELKVSGLHSFREEQTIDFSSLSEAGIFGIFGPTGSGKSSLLDAITLALYGKVERATKNTQGIMNHAEEKLSVSFTFELKKTPVEQYRVERMYRRTKEDGLKIGNCRFLKLGDPVEVLADKERDVTQSVQELLGLTHEDFTRAVVLPQGKFSEFLTLKGADRRKMLQRLFQLEKYGDALNEQLRHRIGNLTVRVKEISAEQQGLGDASKETLKQSRDAFNQANEELTALKETLTSTEQHFQFLREKWKMQQEWNQCQRELEQGQAEQDKIAEMEEQATAGQKAAAVMPVLEEWETVVHNLKSAETALKEKQNEMDRLTEKTETARFKAIQAKSDRDKEDPELQKLQNKYQEGKRIQDACLRDQQGLNKIEKEIHTKNQDLEQANKKIEILEKERHDIKEQIDLLESKIQKLATSSEERHRLQQAIQEKQQLEREKQQLQEDRGSWKDIKMKMTRIQSASDQLKSDKTAWRDHGLGLFNKAGLIYDELTMLHFKFEQAETLLSEEKNRLRLSQKKNEEKVLSLKLVHALEDGKPCPVCGSHEHPDPADEETVSIQHVDQQLEKLDQLLQNLSLGHSQSIRLKDRLEHQAKRLENKLAEAPAQNSVSAESCERLEELDLQEWEKIGSGWLSSIKGYEQDIIELQEKADQWERQGEPLLQKIERMKNESEFYESQMEQLIDKADQRKQLIEKLKNDWHERYTALSYEDLESVWKDVQNKDKQTETAAAKLRKWEQKRDVLISDAEKSEALRRDIMNILSEYKGSSEAKRAALENNFSELHKLEIRLEDPVDEWHLRINKERERLKSAEHESEAVYRKLAEEKVSGEKELTKLQTIKENLQDRKTAVEGHLSRSKEEQGFTDHKEIREAFLPKERILSLQKEIKQHHEKISQLKHQLDRLRILLGGKRFTEEEYDLSESSYKQAKQNYEDGLQKEAQLRSEWESLNKKAERYAKLDAEKSQQEGQLSLHTELQKLFKGNVFVEFVAEEQLHHICVAASKRLGELTRARYALEVDSGGGFVIRDDANGGIKRPVSSLSGGETFLTSLALALSLSEQIQLSGEVPLQFFFLDEGFGTLDQELLDTVITALEKLHMNQFSIGIISHVPELQERLPKKIMVTPAAAGGQGSRIMMKNS